MNVGRTSLPPTVARVLERTPVHAWGWFAVLVDEVEGRPAKIFDRTGLAPWLRANDLSELADEAASRATRPSTGLLLLILGKEGPRFKTIDGERREPGVPRGRTRPRPGRAA